MVLEITLAFSVFLFGGVYGWEIFGRLFSAARAPVLSLTVWRGLAVDIRVAVRILPGGGSINVLQPGMEKGSDGDR